jgi:hypothetical protein
MKDKGKANVRRRLEHVSSIAKKIMGKSNSQLVEKAA